MKEYNKEKLHEYAKELFSLCLEKGISFEYYSYTKEFTIDVNGVDIHTHCNNTWFLIKNDNTLPIWELIEKVKQL